MQETLASHPTAAARALWRAELRALLSLGLPLAGTQLAHVAISTTNVLLLGWLGADALAAGALGISVYFAPFMFCNGLAVAVAPLISQAIGRRDSDAVRVIAQQGIWVSTASGFVFAVILWHIEPIFLLMGQDPAVSAAATPYTRILAVGLLPSLWFSVLRSGVAALGHPRPVFVVMLAGFVVNIAVSWVLMFGVAGAPRLGVTGAAVGVGVTQLFMFVILLAYARFAHPMRRFRLTHEPHLDWPRLKQQLHLGVPIGGTVVLEIGLFSAAVLLMGLLSPAHIAAHQIAVQCAAIVFMIPLGFAQASTIRVGYAAGRGDRAGVQRAGWAAFGLGAVCMAATATLLALLPRTLTAAFIDIHNPANAEVVALAVSFLYVAAVFQVADGAQVIGSAALRGLHDTRVPMLLAGIGFWAVGFTASVVLAFSLGLGGIGIWIGLALGLAAAAVLLVHRFHRLSR